MSSIGAVGIDHRRAGTGLVRLSADRLERALGPLAEAGRVDELLLVSAAGGIEVYFACRDPRAAAVPLAEAILAIVHDRTTDRPRARPVRRQGVDAIRRLFRVAAGLESLAPGAEEVRRALRAADRAGTLGPVLRRLCVEALHAATRARQCAGLGATPDQLASLVEGEARRFADDGRPEGRFEVIDGHAARLDVLVLRVMSPLDTGSIHGRGHGLLSGDRGIEVTFLLDQSDFVRLRERILRREGEVRFSVPMNDVTAIDATRSRRPALV
jgi:Glutamyl-tRNAGlu reductase, N-terminal domain